MQAFWQDVSKVFDLVDPLLRHSAKKRIMMQRTTHLKLPDTVFLRPILLTQTRNDATNQELSAPGQLIWVLLVWFASCSEIKHFQMQPLVFLRVRSDPWAHACDLRMTWLSEHFAQPQPDTSVHHSFITRLSLFVGNWHTGGEGRKSWGGAHFFSLKGSVL